jgi:hypothetical protein
MNFECQIINSSPVLAKLVRSVSVTPDATTSDPGEPGASLTLVQLPHNHVVLAFLPLFSPYLPSSF